MLSSHDWWNLDGYHAYDGQYVLTSAFLPTSLIDELSQELIHPQSYLPHSGCDLLCRD